MSICRENNEWMYYEGDTYGVAFNLADNQQIMLHGWCLFTAPHFIKASRADHAVTMLHSFGAKSLIRYL